MSNQTNIRVARLGNGMTVITDRMESVETASLGVWVNAGTRHETADINGISHLLEHMAFKGTERRSARAIAEEIEAVGGHLNAYTSREHTAYYAKVLKEDVGLAFDILADILQHSVLDADELAREQAVVVQEISQAIDTPDDIIFDHFQATAFPGQAVGRPVLGTAELVRSLSRPTVASYMRDNYGGNRMVLAAAGKVDHDVIIDLAERHFTALPPDRVPAWDSACYAGGEYREARDLEQVHLVLGFDGIPYDDPDFYAASTLSTLLGGGMSSRLFQEVREKRGLVYSIYSFTTSYVDGGLFAIYAGTGEAEVAEVIPVICDEIMKVAAEVQPAEVQRARAQLKASILMSMESTSSRCEQLARQMLVYGRPVPADEMVAKVEAVDEAAVLSVAKRLFAGRPTFASIGPLGNVESLDRVKERLGYHG
jgi:predicted Zn-dependent peptidase